MNNNFYTLLTNAGINELIRCKTQNLALNLKTIAVGDGDIIPSQTMQSLQSEKHRFSINSITQDETNPNYFVIEGVIPSEVGGFYISEVGIYTQNGVLFAIGNLPRSYKPLLSQGSAKDFTFKVFVEIESSTNVTLKIDDSVVLATRNSVKSELKNYALINGDETKRFKVANAQNDNEAINLLQMQDNLELLKNNLQTEIANMSELVINEQQVLQVAYVENSQVVNTSLSIPINTHIPKITDGYAILELFITPKKNSSRFRIDVSAYAKELINGTDFITVALFRNDEEDAVYWFGSNNSGTSPNSAAHNLISDSKSFVIDNNSLELTKFTVKIGSSNSTPISINKLAYDDIRGYVLNRSNMIITEIA